ncbi:hypothetical protein D3C75_1320230 [compost metagenome]
MPGYVIDGIIHQHMMVAFLQNVELIGIMVMEVGHLVVGIMLHIFNIKKRVCPEQVRVSHTAPAPCYTVIAI